MRFKSLYASWIALVLLLVLAAPGYAQVQITDLGYHQPKPLEPGDGTEMASSPDTDDGQAALGEGFIVFKFEVRDIDPIADDRSDVFISCIIIENLGTATGGSSSATGNTEGVTNEDIVQVMVMDQDSNSVDDPDEPTEPGEQTGTGTGGCDGNVLQRTNDPGNAQIAWEAFFTPDFIIPDDGSEIFQVAVRINETDNLDDESQNHTLMLRATIVVEEVVGSPPEPTLFIERTMDNMPEVIWNGGINSWTEDTWVINPLMPGEKGVVSRFTLCDWDANEHQLIINRFFIKQDEDGTALSSDLTSLDLYRVEGFTRTLLASRTPDGDFHRSSGAANGMPLPGFDSGDFSDPTDDPRFALTIPDDTCYTFELEAKISPFAMKGHTIKPRIQISAEEPRSTPISDTVQPEIVTSAITVIGKGLIRIPDVNLIGKPGMVPLNIEGFQLPGFATLQVGPRGKLQYNPNVIQIKSITGMDPYIVDAVEIDNRRGEVRFSVRIDPLVGNPFLTGLQNGAVAYIRIEPVGNPGEMSRWVLTYDCVEIVAQMNCLPVGFPFQDTPNQNPNNDISVSTGKVTLVHMGDVDLDGQPTVSDAVKVATALLDCIGEVGLPTAPGPQTPSYKLENKTLMVLLTDEQKSIADVAPPFAPENEIPDCRYLTSADVAEIARLAINFDSMAAPKPNALAAGAAAQGRPWYSFLTDMWTWLTGTPQAGLAQVGVQVNADAQTVDIRVDNVRGTSALGGMQGRLYFDPAAMQVNHLSGLNGYEILAAKVDNVAGEIRFVALVPKGQGVYRGDIVRLHVNVISDRVAPTLALEFLVDENGEDIPFAFNETQGFALNPFPLQLNDVQALPLNGGIHIQAFGQGIIAIQVQVFDLGGGMVFDQSADGHALVFTPVTRQGQPLANGVYLYTLTVRGNHGETLRSQVKKLVILR